MKITYRVHAVVRMFERGISTRDVMAALEEGQEIATYDGDTPYPSRLLLGYSAGRPIHVVAAYNALEDETIVITVYEPDLEIWDATFKRRKS